MTRLFLISAVTAALALTAAFASAAPMWPPGGELPLLPMLAAFALATPALAFVIERILISMRETSDRVIADALVWPAPQTGAPQLTSAA